MRWNVLRHVFGALIFMLWVASLLAPQQNLALLHEEPPMQMAFIFLAVVWYILAVSYGVILLACGRPVRLCAYTLLAIQAFGLGVFLLHATAYILDMAQWQWPSYFVVVVPMIAFLDIVLPSRKEAEALGQAT